MSDLVEWLREQLDADEVRAADCVGDDVAEWVAGETADNGEPYVGKHFANWLPSRVLAEVEAKRRILELFDDATNDANWWYEDRITRLLAAPFRGRPGWRDEWSTE